MTYEEANIVEFLKGFPEDFVHRKEIARKAMGRQAFEENPHWADAALTALLDQEVLEQNTSGHYRMKVFGR